MGYELVAWKSWNHRDVLEIPSLQSVLTALWCSAELNFNYASSYFNSASDFLECDTWLLQWLGENKHHYVKMNSQNLLCIQRSLQFV